MKARKNRSGLFAFVPQYLDPAIEAVAPRPKQVRLVCDDFWIITQLYARLFERKFDLWRGIRSAIKRASCATLKAI